MIHRKGFSFISYPNNLVIGITIVASLFSFLHIGRKNIWIDEGVSMLIAKLPWRDFWAVLSSKEINMWLYFLLLKLWIFLGDNEFAVRSLSALFAIASIPVLYALTKRLFGERAGLITILLISVNAFFIEYAQEARGYTLVFFLVILSSYLFVRVIEDPANKKMVCGYVCISALALYTHIFAALVLMVQTVSALVLPPNTLRTRRLLLSNLMIVILFIPMAFFILKIGGDQISWIPKASVLKIKELFMDLSGDAGHMKYSTMFYMLPCSITLAHAFATFFKKGRSLDTWRYAFIFFWLVIPIFLVYGISFIKPMFLSRYFIVSLPGLVLLAGVGIALIEDKYCYTILLILLTLLSVRSTITQYYPKEKEENNRDSASFVLSHAQRGDGILFYRAGAIVCFEYYWKRLNPPADLIDSVYPTKFGQYKYKDHDLTVSYLESLKDRNERIWVVLRQNGDEFRFIPNTLKKNYQLQQEKNYTGIHVLLFVKKKVS